MGVSVFGLSITGLWAIVLFLLAACARASRSGVATRRDACLTSGGNNVLIVKLR
jgi:hypothetical protein